jgi:uncharacterized protein YecE (DUF72 family)
VRVRLRAGTSGFSFSEWKGPFYPEKLPARDMLSFYAGRFSTVEINNTFYRMPNEALVQGWAAQVPEGFTFAIKAPQRITHIKRLKECAEPLSILFRIIGMLGGRLGPVLFQLPPNFRKDVPRLEAFFAAMPADRPRRIAIEYRHASWFDDETFAAMRAHGIALCVADTGEEPVAPLAATADFGYLRLRRETFDDAELAAWAKRIDEQPWSDAWVFLKHEEEGKGPKLAARLLEVAGT